jgi:hypothetical protein
MRGRTISLPDVGRRERPATGTVRALWAEEVPECELSALVTPKWSPEGAPEVAVDERLLTSKSEGSCSPGLIASWACRAVQRRLELPVRVVVADKLPGLVGVSAARQLVALHPLVVAPHRCCKVDRFTQDALIDAFVRSGLAALGRALAGVPSSVADVVIDLLSYSGASAPALERFLRTAPLLVRPHRELLAWAAEERLLRVLAGHENHCRPTRAYDLLLASADLTLIPRIQLAYGSATSAETRNRLVHAHRALAEKGYRVETATDPAVIRRRTYEGRLTDVDTLIVELLRAGRAGADGEYRGVNLGAWSGAIAHQHSVMIVDHAVADGTTSLELSARLAAAFPGPVPAACVVGTDLAMELFLLRLGTMTGVFDYGRRLLQVRVDGQCLHRSLWDQDDDLLREERIALAAHFEALSDDEKDALRVRWISPAAAEVEARDGRRLSFAPHDIREPYGGRVHVARAFGILYTGVRYDCDSPTYFKATHAEKALVAMATTVVAGGLVVAGNVVDVEGQLEPYVDFEVRQVVGGASGRQLRLCERSGAGLGIGEVPIPLPPFPDSATLQ